MGKTLDEAIAIDLARALVFGIISLLPVALVAIADVHPSAAVPWVLVGITVAGAVALGVFALSVSHYYRARTESARLRRGGPWR